MNDFRELHDFLTVLHLPILIAGIVLAVSLTRLFIRILGRLIDKALPPAEHERRCPCAEPVRA